MAVVSMIKECCPDIPMHASTQMTVHNLSGVKMMQKLGFSRVVLARELSLNEIEYICKNSEIEIETFIHGAHCMCVSGSCYLSSMLGERSGNRGLCAQPCRLDFKCNGRGYALSLKDMCAIPYIKTLENVGVCSVKIEGRMKRPEYVAAAVNACRMAREGLKPDLETLKAVFSRSGFTDGYIKANRGADMFGYRREEDAESTKAVLGKLSELYRSEYSRIGVDMKVRILKDQSTQLTVTDGEYETTVCSDAPSVAQSRACDYEYIKKSMEKTGNTPFFLRNLRRRV